MMRPDQAERLAELEELLTEEFLNEADPREWPGAGQPVSSWTGQIRGDRVWLKKGAIGTAATLRQVQDLKDRHLANTTTNPDTQARRDADLDVAISRAEREAEKLLRRVQEAGSAPK